VSAPPRRVNLNVFTVEEVGGHFVERALTGYPLDLVVLPREPRTVREQEWVRDHLRTRLVPGGMVVTPVADVVGRRPPMPPRPDPKPRKRTWGERLRGEHPLPDGCVVREGQTCPHGWMVRALG
jgi:hypothetical protein